MGWDVSSVVVVVGGDDARGVRDPARAWCRRAMLSSVRWRNALRSTGTTEVVAISQRQNTFRLPSAPAAASPSSPFPRISSLSPSRPEQRDGGARGGRRAYGHLCLVRLTKKCLRGIWGEAVVRTSVVDPGEQRPPSPLRTHDQWAVVSNSIVKHTIGDVSTAPHQPTPHHSGCATCAPVAVPT